MEMTETIKREDGNRPVTGDPCQKTGKSRLRRMLASGTFRFLGWWSIFAGALAMNSVCPICGNAACPVGVGTTGILAGIMAGFKQWGGPVIRSFIGLFRTRKAADEGDHSASCPCPSCREQDHHHNPSPLSAGDPTTEQKP